MTSRWKNNEYTEVYKKVTNIRYDPEYKGRSQYRRCWPVITGIDRAFRPQRALVSRRTVIADDDDRPPPIII